MKKIIKILGVILVVFIIARFYYFLTDDFRLSNIETPSEYTFKTTSSVFRLTRQQTTILQNLFDQPFYYKAKGAQSYAFISESGEYILKFFKMKHMRPSIVYNWLPPVEMFIQAKQAKLLQKRLKVEKIFKGYETAYKYDRENAALLWVHLVPTQGLNLTVQLRDKVGLNYNLDLNNYVFILQRRGTPLREHLTKLIQDKQPEEAKASLKAILDMYVREYKIGIFDHDHGVMQNTGFTSKGPFRLDVGKLLYSDEYKNPEFYKEDLAKVVAKMDTWIQKNAGAYAKELSLFLNSYR